MTVRRRICWPNPDQRCLDGTCQRCHEYPKRDIVQIRRHVREKAMLDEYFGR